MPFQGKNRGRPAPPDSTSEEANYLKALGEKQKLVSLKLADGEVVRGWIEYYDKTWSALLAKVSPISSSSNTKSCTSPKTRTGKDSGHRVLLKLVLPIRTPESS